MKTKIIYFVRHGQSELNVKDIRQDADGSLSERGRMQVAKTAHRFIEQKARPTKIIASPFQRTRETAAIIADVLKLPVEYSELVVERKNPSEIVGHAGDEQSVREMIDRIDRSYHDDSLRISNEENFVDLRDRAKKALDFIAHRPEKSLIVVTHGIFLKMLVCYMLLGDVLTASEYNNLSYLNPMDNAGLTICTYTTYWFRKPEWKLLVWNNVSQVERGEE